MDLSGTAALITALGVIYSIYRQERMDRRQAKMELAGIERDKIAKATHDLVNGMTLRKESAIASGSYAEGKAAGVIQERDRPEGGGN